MSSVKAAKVILRKVMKLKLSLLTGEEKAKQSAIVTQMLLGEEFFAAANSVAVYMNTPDEVYTLDILKQALRSGKRCYVPRYFTQSENHMDMVHLKDMEDYERLPLTRWNIKQPLESEIREEALDTEGGLDLIIVPGLAFTACGRRLGRGKGFYDAYLQRCGGNCHSVALAFNEQVVVDVPTDNNDVVLNKVIYPNRRKEG